MCGDELLPAIRYTLRMGIPRVLIDVERLRQPSSGLGQVALSGRRR